MANREIEARLKLSAVDRTGAAFKALSGRLNAVDRQAKSFNRANSMMAKSAVASYAAMARFAAPAAIAYGLTAATKRFAAVEDRIARIGITADASAEKTRSVLSGIQQIASDMAVPVDDVATALETLVASGQSLDDAMAFLPSVVKSAQATGAATEDLATTADAVSRSLGIMGDKSQVAFDIMAAGGKAGKFELKDMAQYLPSIIPAFAAMGYKGEDALGKLVSMLQTVRNYTGDSSEAATSLQNVFQKMGSEETVKKFAGFGINLRKEMALAKKEGRDLIDTFVDLSLKATKGDLSKLPQLFTDAQFLAGMRALIQGRDATADMAANLKDAAGTVQNDFNRVIDLTQQKLTRLSSSWDKFMTNVGSVVSVNAVPALDFMNEGMDQAQFVNQGLERRGMSWWEQKKWWLAHGFDTRAQGLMAYGEGWRSPEGKVAAQGPMSASPELPSRRQESNIPIPTPRPMPLSRAEQYAAYGRGRSRVPKPAMPLRDSMDDGSDPNYSEFLKAARGDGIAEAGDKAGQSISQGAKSINEEAQKGGSTFASMLEGMGARIGREAAAAFNANVRVPSAGAVRADTGRSQAGHYTGGPK